MCPVFNIIANFQLHKSRIFIEPFRVFRKAVRSQSPDLQFTSNKVNNKQFQSVGCGAQAFLGGHLKRSPKIPRKASTMATIYDKHIALP